MLMDMTVVSQWEVRSLSVTYLLLADQVLEYDDDDDSSEASEDSEAGISEFLMMTKLTTMRMVIVKPMTTQTLKSPWQDGSRRWLAIVKAQWLAPAKARQQTQKATIPKTFRNVLNLFLDDSSECSSDQCTEYISKRRKFM